MKKCPNCGYEVPEPPGPPYEYTGYMRPHLPVILKLLRMRASSTDIVRQLRHMYRVSPSTALIDYIRRRYDIPARPLGEIVDHEQRRQQIAARYRGEKITLRQLGSEFGISIERVRQIICRAERLEAAQKRGAALFQEAMRVEDVPLDALNLSTRLANCLKSEDCLTVGDAMKLTDQELRRVPNFGVTSLRELRKCLEDVQREFADRKLRAVS